MADQRLLTLLSVVDEASYTKAGQALGLSQGSVTYHIQQLEKEYDIRIFNRPIKNYNLTPEGEVLVKYARRMAAMSESLRRELNDLRQEARHFSVGMTPTCGESVGQIFSTYCSDHPNISLSIMTDSRDHLQHHLDDFALDFALMEGPVNVKHCAVELLDVDYLCVALSTAHPLARRTSITLPELKKERLILRRGEAGTRKQFESALAAQMESISNFDVRLEMDNINTIKELVAANLGVTIISSRACRDETAGGLLRTLPIEGMRMVREIHIVYQADFAHPETIGEIRRLFVGR